LWNIPSREAPHIFKRNGVYQYSLFAFTVLDDWQERWRAGGLPVARFLLPTLLCVSAAGAGESPPPIDLTWTAPPERPDPAAFRQRVARLAQPSWSWDASSGRLHPMDLKSDAVIPFSRQDVFATYRDQTLALSRYLPDVRGVEIRSRKEDGPIVEIVSDWRGGGEIPAIARAVLSEGMLSWTDHTRWNADTLSCDFRTETRAFAEAFRCTGQTLFTEDASGRTTMSVRGTLAIDASKIRGVPGFLAGRIGRAIEDAIGGSIHRNLVATAKALTALLEQRRGA
jgi:hypothetical protein